MTDACKLFDGVNERKLPSIITGLKGVKRSYGDGQIIIEQGERTDKIGVVISGFIKALRYNDNGTASLISLLSKNSIFADFLAVSDSKESPVTLISEGECAVLFLPAGELFLPPKELEAEARLILWNLAKVFSDQYFELKDRLYCITAPSLREKIMRLLEAHDKNDGNGFTLPYNREQMAAYLNSERSALSRELMRMKAEGIIDYKGNIFTIKKSAV